MSLPLLPPWYNGFNMDNLDEYFTQLNMDKVLVDAGYKSCISMIDSGSSFSEVISYLDKGAGAKALHYLSDVRRLWCMMKAYLLSGEDGYASGILQADPTASVSQLLLSEYELTLFSLRRLLFQLSEASVLEAMEYLKSASVAPYTIIVILQNEQLSSHPLWKVMIPEIMKDVWSEDEKRQFAGGMA